jgi:hypothetical protein
MFSYTINYPYVVPEGARYHVYKSPPPALIQSHMNPTQSYGTYFSDILNNTPASSGLSWCYVFLPDLLCSFLMCPMLCPSCSEVHTVKLLFMYFFPTLLLLPLRNRNFHFCVPPPPPPHFPQDERPKLMALKVNTVDHCSLCKLLGFHGCLSTGGLVCGFFTV